VLISSDFDEAVRKVKSVAPENSDFELFIKKDSNFLVSDANEVISKAYLASKNPVFLILASNIFSEIVQNRLLKVIEEPPKNKEFILITQSRATLLPTITSRLPVINLDKANSGVKSLDINLDSLTIVDIYNFVKTHKRAKPKEISIVVEEIVKRAVLSGKFNLDKSDFKLFRDVRVVINLGSSVEFILITLLMRLLSKKR
jgi:DNA polymerase-3 subunit delta'